VRPERFTEKRRGALAGAGGDVLCDGSDWGPMETLVAPEHGSFIAGNGRYRSKRLGHMGIVIEKGSEAYQIQVPAQGTEVDSRSDTCMWPMKIRSRTSPAVYNHRAGAAQGRPGAIELLLGGGGDQGDPVEESTHPKPPESLTHLENPRDVPMAKTSNQNTVNPSGRVAVEGTTSEQGESSKNGGNQMTLLDYRKDWALEVYQGKSTREEEAGIEDAILEPELDEEEAIETSRVMGIAIYYSRKSFNPKILFSDMIHAWGIQKMVAVDKLGDYIFKVEFMREEEERVIGGGPWRHKGDAVIVVHYDGLAQPLEIKIQDIGLRARL
jgi:hypothetical protein